MADAAPLGRPSKYKPEYCQMLIDHMASGLSFECFAGLIGTCDDTLREWEKVHPDFSAARKTGTAACRYWWESNGRDNLNAKFYQPAVHIFNMKNRFRWTDKLEISGTEGEAIKLAYDPAKRISKPK